MGSIQAEDKNLKKEQEQEKQENFSGCTEYKRNKGIKKKDL